MKNKKKYFPNNWKAYKDAHHSFFIPIPYDEFMDWKIAGWEMPSSVVCMIRETNKRTGKVKEYVYQREHAAKNKAREIMDIGESEFIVCTPHEIHHMEPELNYDEFEDPLA
tara:strand:- start:90 stop:422 length:333 start_codon:yes stop_codon:yes gene_type:complete